MKFPPRTEAEIDAAFDAIEAHMRRAQSFSLAAEAEYAHGTAASVALARELQLRAMNEIRTAGEMVRRELREGQEVDQTLRSLRAVVRERHRSRACGSA